VLIASAGIPLFGYMTVEAGRAGHSLVRRLFGPLFYYCKRLLVPILQY
jgi:hypothetical protein